MARFTSRPVTDLVCSYDQRHKVITPHGPQAKRHNRAPEPPLPEHCTHRHFSERIQQTRRPIGGGLRSPRTAAFSGARHAHARRGLQIGG